MPKWNYSKGSLPNNTLSNGNYLFIYGAKEYNEGTYECYGLSNFKYSWSSDGVPFYSKATLKVAGTIIHDINTNN